MSSCPNGRCDFESVVVRCLSKKNVDSVARLGDLMGHSRRKNQLGDWASFEMQLAILGESEIFAFLSRFSTDLFESGSQYLHISEHDPSSFLRLMAINGLL